MFHPIWKDNWAESRQHYLDWWERRGLVISMWEYLDKAGNPHEDITAPLPARDWHQFWFDPEWRARYIHYRLAHSSFKADILPVANTQLGPGSLAAILGASLEGAEDTIWIHPTENASDEIVFTEVNPWWQLHLALIHACREQSRGRYFVGCPDLMEGLDVLAGLRGTQPVLMDMIDRPEVLESQLRAVNQIWFEVFEQIYQLIHEQGEMAFCYFSLWAPGRMAKLQCDLAGMISPRNFRRFVQPFIREQCQHLEYSMYHLDGVNAIRHLDALLEIEELDAIQWTPGVGQPQGGDPCWFELYRRILAGGKALMVSWVEVSELQPLLDAIGSQGVHVLMHFESENDIDQALVIADRYR